MVVTWSILENKYSSVVKRIVESQEALVDVDAVSSSEDDAEHGNHVVFANLPKLEIRMTSET